MDDRPIVVETTVTPNPTLASNASGWGFFFCLSVTPLVFCQCPCPCTPLCINAPPPSISTPHHIKKRAKGWDGKSTAPRLPESGSGALPATRDNFAFSSSGPTVQVPLDKMYETMPVQDGSAAVHTVVHCTLADLMCTMNLHVKDAAFALNRWAARSEGGRGRDDDDSDRDLTGNGQGRRTGAEHQVDVY